MKRFYFTIIVLLATLVANAQTIKVYEYDDNGNLSNTPAYTSSKKVKVVFAEEQLSGNVAGHDWVDLGLPSGTLWATRNIGALSDTDPGDYYAWGETIGSNDGKTAFNKNTYKTSLAKYNNNGNPDSKTVLEEQDDVANIKWQNGWRMPTLDEVRELLENCYIVGVNNYNNSGVEGIIVYKVKDSRDKGIKQALGVAEKKTYASYTLSDNHIFFPCSGSYSYNDGTQKTGLREIMCWSSCLYNENDTQAYVLCFGTTNILTFYVSRYIGISIRPVRSSK